MEKHGIINDETQWILEPYSAVDLLSEVKRFDEKPMNVTSFFTYWEQLLDIKYANDCADLNEGF